MFMTVTEQAMFDDCVTTLTTSKMYGYDGSHDMQPSLQFQDYANAFDFFTVTVDF